MPPSRPSPSLAGFSAYLASRHEAILEAWREATLGDPVLTTAASLTRAQFRDHIPEVLDALQHKLSSPPGGAQEARAEAEIKEVEAKHGRQRWQLGFRLGEAMREWGFLHLVLAQELEAYAATNQQWAPADHWAAARTLILLINEGVAESADRYASLERSEAAGRAVDLNLAVSRLEDLKQRRAALIHQAVHDLRGNVQSVSGIATVLGEADVPEADRRTFANLLQNSVEVLDAMVTELMELARLEAGHENRAIGSFDAGQLASELCQLNVPRAAEKNLYLKHSGPTPLLVEGDASKVRRLLQNLLLNALKYTDTGGVTVTWGTERGHWWAVVEDTGPGLLSGPGAPLAHDLREATVVAREADERAAKETGRVSHVLNQAEAGTPTPLPPRQQPGEGIGLSIVKRLCDLLDASLEMTSSRESGTKVRVLFPLAYAKPEEKPGG